MGLATADKFDWASFPFDKVKKRRLIIAFGISTAVLVIAVWWLSYPLEPSYRGRRLSAWWDELNRSPSDDESPAGWQARWVMLTNVVHSIGTNALPFYVTCLNHKPPPKWADKVDDWIRDKTSGRAYLPQSKDRMLEAQVCIEILGPAATPAIPDLARLLASEYSCGQASLCLAAIGPAALPTLSNAVATSSNPRVRYAALEALGSLGTGAQSASPLLWKIIQGTNSSAGFSLGDLALRALVEIETNKNLLMPLLVKCLEDTNTAAGAAYGLARVGTPGIHMLLQAITNENSKIRSAAQAALDMHFQKLSADPSARFNRFNGLFNLKLTTSQWSFYSGSEYQRMEPVLLRYGADSNVQIQAAASNALAFVKTRTNATTRGPLPPMSDD